MQASNSVLSCCGDMHNIQERLFLSVACAALKKNIYEMPNRTKQMDMCRICRLFITIVISAII